MDVIIAVGFDRNDGKGTLSLDRQREFLENLTEGVEWVGGTVNAKIAGFSEGGEWGAEPGLWIAATIPAANVYYLEGYLKGAAGAFHQDAIAFTTGTTEILDAV